MKPPRVRWNATEARVERFVRLAQRLGLPVFGFEVRGPEATILTRPREADCAPRAIPSSAGSVRMRGRRSLIVQRKRQSNQCLIPLIVRGNRASVSVGGTGDSSDASALRHHHRRPEGNARGEEVEYQPSAGEVRASGAGRAEPARDAGLPGAMMRRSACTPRLRRPRQATAAHGERPARRLRALPRVLPPRPAHPDRLPEGTGRRGARYGSAPLGIVNSVALKGNVLDWIEVRWAGKGADRRLDPFKFALSWATGRHPERCQSTTCTASRASTRAPTRRDHLGGRRGRPVLPRAPERMRTRCGWRGRPAWASSELVELERSEIKRAPDGSRAIILRPNKRRRRIVNMPLTPAAEAIIDKAPISRRLILKPCARRHGTRPGCRARSASTPPVRDPPGARFNDLRGTKVTEMVWSGSACPTLRSASGGRSRPPRRCSASTPR